MQVQSFLVVLSKAVLSSSQTYETLIYILGSVRALDADSLARITSIATVLTTSFASYDLLQTEIGVFEGSNTMNQETSCVNPAFYPFFSTCQTHIFV